MRALAIVHQRDAGAGVFADAARSRQVELDTWLRAETDSPPGRPAEYDAVLTFGGAMHADHEDRHPWLRKEKLLLAELLERGVPLLAVCLGSQLLAVAAGGTAQRAAQPEIGWHRVDVTNDGTDDPVIGALAPSFEAFQWHSYEGVPPAGATVLAQSPVCVQAYRVGDAAWGIQFHAEVTLADAEKWISETREDEDAVKVGVDAEALRDETRERMAGWNELGRGVCSRFFDAISS